MTVDYQQVYNHDYFNGKKSFFWRGGYGGYGALSNRYFDNLYAPVKALIPHLPKKAKVLDIGCAYGLILDRFPQSFEKYGTDVSSHAIEEGKKRFPQFILKVADAEKPFPFKKNFFDLIISNDVLEHVENPELMVKNAFNSLKKGGLIYLTTPNFNFIRRIFYKIPDRMEHHISLQTHEELLDLFRAAGLHIETHWTFYNIYYYLRCEGNCGVESAVIARK
jgi:2-polyprenyl-3-methyl-5-hydroxy-6-metoxy-1,4-benzoquinol methylase